LVRSFTKPSQRLGVALRHATTFLILGAETCLGGGVALVGSEAIPLYRLNVILWHALAGVADFISVEQGVVTMQIENALYNSEPEVETVTLTVDKARELAKALLSVVGAIELGTTATSLRRLDRNLARCSPMN
jgi:hypothetical protein